MAPLNDLKSVLCDLEGKCCIVGSEADRLIVDKALAALEAAQPASSEQISDLITHLQETASKGVSVWGDLQMQAASALTQNHMQIVAWKTRAEMAEKKLAAQPAGEPAGHFIPKTTNFFGKVTEWDQVMSPHGTALYTHPAPQVPMTDAEIMDKWQAAPGSFMHGLVRAIEAHHKIGVKP